MNRHAPSSAALLLALVAVGCGSVRTDEGLVMLDVSASATVPAFASVRFSVVGRPSVPTHEVPSVPAGHLRFGYYLPGPDGAAQVQAEALSTGHCTVGQGTAAVDVQLGRVSPSVPLLIGPAPGAAADGGTTCAAPLDAAADRPRHDAAADRSPHDAAAHDAAADRRSGDGSSDGRRPDSGVPMCLAATRACTAAASCCSGLTCSTNSIGKVCCGAYGARCTLANGTDCCGDLECINGGCCLPATRPCQGGDCCLGLTCGTTSLGHVCCGSSGAPCTRTDGADCCGTLSCRNGTCAP
ncbi:MAG: hypothetical protein ACJ8F1_17615 [Polyangia bacterium]